MDLDRGRRTGSYAEMCDYIRLIHMLNVIHQEGGGPFEPMDLPAPTRHLDLYLAEITLTDKNWQPQTFGRARTTDALEMVAISLAAPSTRSSISRCSPASSTPIRRCSSMCRWRKGLITLAEHGQVNVITPFTLAGAMSPVTLAGALAQQHAEAMAGIVLAQIVRPGVPVMYGGFTSNVDMRSGAPAFGTPEYAQAAQATGQLARRIGVPFRSSNATAANDVDAQAAYESAMSLWGSVMGGAHLILHAAGWLGGGLTASFEKLIIDAEMLQMMAAYLQPFEVSEQSLAFEAIREWGRPVIISARRTRLRATRRRSTGRSCRSGTITTPGGNVAPKRRAPRQHHLEATPEGVSAAASRSRDRGGAQGLCRAAQARGRAPAN